MTKSQIRSICRELRDGLLPEEQGILSKSISEKLFQVPEFNNCSRLLTYVSFKSEVGTHNIIQYAVDTGKKVYIPRVEPQGLEFYRINDLNGLIPSKLGVLEPPSDETHRFQIQNKTDPDLMLLPGLAFDVCGNRIGYGAGYYDRYLSLHRPEYFIKIALAYDFQVVDMIAAEANDIRVDLIITPTRIIKGLK